MHKFVLPGGLTVILHKVEGVVSVSSGLWVKTGSRHERPDEYGYAHFLEHMFFKGTKNNSALDLARKVDRVGGQHNGATNKEYTCYYINLIADHLDLSMDLLSDMFYNPLFAAEDVEKEKGIVLEEIKMYEDYADEHVLDLFMESMFSGHPLAHNILGTKKSIESLTREKILKFYNERYASDKCILSIAGNIDIEATKHLVFKYFSEVRPANTEEKTDCRIERLYRHHIDREIEQVHFCLGFEGLSRHNDSRYALYLLSTILGGSSSSRLFQNIREKEGLCYSIFSFHSSYNDEGAFGIYCSASPDKFEKAKNLALDECRRIMKDGVTEEELADAKAYMKGNLALSLESTEVKMGHNALEEMTYGCQYSFEDLCHLIDKVTMDDLKKIIAHVFSRREVGYISIGRIKKVDKSILLLY